MRLFHYTAYTLKKKKTSVKMLMVWFQPNGIPSHGISGKNNPPEVMGLHKFHKLK
jgi:hypothetical protein